MTAPLTLDALNAMDAAGFATALDGIVEHSPWVIEAAAGLRPFRDFDDLHAALMAVVGKAGEDRQLGLLCAHPDLGSRLLDEGGLTAESNFEQASVGLDSLDAAGRAHFAELNAAYRAKFGFPFIIAARDHTRDEILDKFARRLANEPAAEQAAALREIARIVRWRIADRMAAHDMEEGREHQPVDCPRDGQLPPGAPMPNTSVRDLPVAGSGTGGLSTHILDTAHGRPAEGVTIELYRGMPAEGDTPLYRGVTNADGRTPEMLLPPEAMAPGRYTIVFHIGVYFRAAGASVADPPFLDTVPVSFAIADTESHYHVPLLAAPWGYSTYRGS